MATSFPNHGAQARGKAERRLQLLSEIAGRLLMADQPESQLGQLLASLSAHTGLETHLNYLMAPDGGSLRLQSYAGVPPEAVERIGVLNLDQTVCGAVARSRMRIVVEDIRQSQDPRTALLRSLGIQAYVCHPLQAHDRLIGTLAFGTRNRTHFDLEELDLLETVSNQIAVAVDRARLVTQLEAAKARTDAHKARLEDLAAVLERERSLLGAVNEASPLAIWALDAQGRVRLWNPAAERIFGWPADRVKGRLLPDLPLDPPVGDLSALMSRWSRGEMLDGEERRVRRPDGSMVEVNVWTAALTNTCGAFDGVVGLMADITAHKRLEEQFRQSQKMEAMGVLAGGVAHDFNNLLTIMSGYGRMLLDETPDDNPSHDPLDQIVNAADRAAELTSQLLAFGRRRMLQAKPLDLNHVVANLERMLRRVLAEDIELVTLPGPALGYVKADQSQIEQILLNLVINARDAMPQGGRIEIETANLDLRETGARTVGAQPGAYVTLEVKDTGTGMDAATRERIFEPFFTTKEKGRGTGLGLSTVYGIVKQHGGEIAVDSEPGQGSAFRILLPRVDSEAALERPAPARRRTARGHGAVLLLEDELGVRKLLAEMLTKEGFEVLEACTASEALRLHEARGGRIDLLLTDVVLPEMSGQELAGRLLNRQPGLKVIFMSGHNESTLVDHGISDLGRGFLQKPFTPGALLAALTDALESGPS